MLALVVLVALMPSSCGYTWSDELDSIIRQESDVAGVPLDLAYTFIAAESGFDPTTHVDNAIEDSVGLLELNRRGGQGSGHSVAELMDPRRNLQLGLPAIRRAFEQAWTPDIDPFEFIYQVATRSGHPGQVPRSDARIVRIANLWACFYGGVGLSLQGPGTTEAAVGGAGPTLAAAPALIIMILVVQAFYAQKTFDELASQYSVRRIAERTISIRQLRSAVQLHVLDEQHPPEFLGQVLELVEGLRERRNSHPAHGRRHS